MPDSPRNRKPESENNYASQNGVTAAVRHFIHEFPALKENIVRDWRNAYQLEVKKQSRTDDVEVHELPGRK